MKFRTKFSLILCICIFSYACNQKPTIPSEQKEERMKVEMLTDYGTIKIELYNETPLHRDNFIKIAKEGVYDSVLFHRVIDSFMIQGGDPDSKYAQKGDTLGNGGLEYKVDAEFNPDLFHKKGVLAAARDGNLERASSSTQFYIVDGKVFNDSLLDKAQNRINEWLAQHYFKKDPKNQSLIDSLQNAIDREDLNQYMKYSDSITVMAKDYTDFESYIIPDEHRQIYKTLGGTPHLDQNYTVYGEVIEGLEVVDSISSVATGEFDRPISDVRILSIKIVE